MSTSLTAYPDWKAPAEDGKVLVWPNPAQIIADTRKNAARLEAESSVLLQNIPFSEVRSAMRQWMGIQDGQPAIATGHQTELYHAGVWAKDALIGQVAKELSGQAYHFAVDTDQPKHLSLRWPGGSEPITDDPRRSTAEWSGLLESPTPAHIAHIESALGSENAKWGFEPAAVEFLATLKLLALETPPLSAAITHATHKLDWSLGLRHHALVVSPMFASAPYLLFVHHLLARAEQFAADYNAALADYRRANKVRTPTRPMPDLTSDHDSCEAPFWLDDLAAGGRSRARVIRTGAGWALRLPDGGEFVFSTGMDGWEAARNLATFLRVANVRLSPRALTLTLFFRLLLVDQFIHGIGGGRYDQVTDSLIAGHFNIEPPNFAVTTATLYFPTALGRSRACLPCIAQEGHSLKHRLLGEEKMDWVSRIEALPRHSSERQIAFGRMHGRLAAATLEHPALRDWENRMRQAKEISAQDEVLFDRELFYAIQPKDRLLSVIDQYAAAFKHA